MIGKATDEGHLFKGGIAFPDHPSRRFHAARCHVIAGRHVSLALEEPCKIATAHCQAGGKRLDREILRQVVEDPLVDVADWADRRNLRFKMHAELRLSAGALE